MAEDVQPIIVIKKKGGHGGHHGGAWKVAYADFVTAMMALFIVLWLLNSSVQVRKAVSSYFTDPSGTGSHSGTASTGTGESVSVNKDNMTELKDKLEQALKKSPEFEKIKDYVQMSVTGEGLRVEMLESEKGIFFQSGSGIPSAEGRELIEKLAEELKKLPNDLMIEGYTDAKPFANGEYSNWELSADRANAARRVMEAAGLPHGRVVQVRGFADQRLHDPEHPEAASNRRISVIVRYQDVADDDEEDQPATPGEKSAGGEHGKPIEKSEKPAAKAEH
jgi:chemotaxis protein MotB